MRASIAGHRWSGARFSFLLMGVLTALWSGCTVYEPVPAPIPPYDQVLGSAVGAAEDAGVSIISLDRTTGIIRGVAGSTNVTISIAKRTDGSTQVVFSGKGPDQGYNKELNDRFTRFYNRRMGRK